MLFLPLSAAQSLFQSFQGSDDPSQVAAGCALGAALGLVPKGNLVGLLILVLFFFLRIDKGMAVVTAAIFTPIGYLIDPIAHRVGLAVLTWDPLNPIWTFLYNLPIVPFTRFNNTVVMGNLVIGMVLFAPLFVGFKKLVFFYRARWQERLARTPLLRAVNGWGWVQTYHSWRQKLSLFK